MQLSSELLVIAQYVALQGIPPAQQTYFALSPGHRRTLSFICGPGHPVKTMCRENLAWDAALAHPQLEASYGHGLDLASSGLTNS